MKLKLLFFTVLFCCFTNAQVTISNQVNIAICDVDGNGFETVDLPSYNSQFSGTVTYSFKYFSSLADAQANINVLFPQQILTGSETFYVRVENQQNEYAVGSLNITLESNCEMSVSEIKQKKIQTYPNPVRDFISVRTEENFVQAEVFSLLGTKLLSSKNEKFDISKLKADMYILKVITDKSEQSFKIIKK